MADKYIKDTPVLFNNQLQSTDVIPVCMPLDGSIKNITVEQLLLSVINKCNTLTNMCNSLANRLAEANIKNSNNVIIHQFYGGSGGCVSHNFVELYNPTDSSITLTGKSLHYCTTTSITKIDLSGSIAAKSSFLIKGASASASNPDSTGEKSWLDITGKTADQTITNSFSNKMIGFILTDNTTALTTSVFNNISAITGLLDAVSTTDDAESPSPFYIGQPVFDQSKQKAIRRKLISKSSNNRYDFEKVDYRIKDNLSKAPKCGADGQWSYFLTEE